MKLRIKFLVKKTDFDIKIKDTDEKYLTAADNKKLTSNMLDVKIKQKESVNKSDIDNKNL